MVEEEFVPVAFAHIILVFLDVWLMPRKCKNDAV